MEATVGSPLNHDGDTTKKKPKGSPLQQLPQPLPEVDDEHERFVKRQRISGSFGPAAGAGEDIAAAAGPPAGTGGGSGTGVLSSVSSPGGGSERVQVERVAEAPLPCTGDRQGPSSEPAQGVEIIIIEDDEDEEERDREFERQIALLKGEISRLDALAAELLFLH